MGCKNCDGCIDLVTLATGPVGATGATGATGASGSNGTSGVVIIHNSLTDSGTTAGASPQVLKTYNLPANTLAVAGNIIEVDVVIDGSGDATAASYGAVIYFGGVAIGGVLTLAMGVGNSRSIHIKGEINRLGATSERVVSKVELTDPSSNGFLIGFAGATSTFILNNDIAVDLTSVGGQDIEVKVIRTAGNFTLNQWTCRKLTVKHVKQ